MMALMIEDVCDEQPFRRRALTLHGARIISEIAGQCRIIELVSPGDDSFIEIDAIALQLAPMPTQARRFRNAGLRPRRSPEARHPNLVGPEQVIERAMDRAEKRAALLPARFIGQPVGAGIEVLVLPAIVARHALDVADPDHERFPSDAA